MELARGVVAAGRAADQPRQPRRRTEDEVHVPPGEAVCAAVPEEQHRLVSATHCALVWWALLFARPCHTGFLYRAWHVSQSRSYGMCPNRACFRVFPRTRHRVRVRCGCGQTYCGPALVACLPTVHPRGATVAAAVPAPPKGPVDHPAPRRGSTEIPRLLYHEPYFCMCVCACVCSICIQARTLPVLTAVASSLLLQLRRSVAGQNRVYFGRQFSNSDMFTRVAFDGTMVLACPHLCNVWLPFLACFRSKPQAVMSELAA